jgi:hypothetical protein
MSEGTAVLDRNPAGTAWQHAGAVLAVSAASSGLRSTGGTGLAVCAPVGNPHPFPVRTAAGGMRKAWSGGGTDPVE